ncbi:hypothetical protein [Actinacidiphila acidipaludis]|uniref:Uncharacterized protein n=1 Tax=Actinacidiphila acidipaludis TaxID=2873382 RepID=A0ABS7QAV6_9ACTN|nr:hypothetical protein [Streptomyces acidipaludis]MBY8880251.1 hypothetical protein [Streptomyces acidipaludis]
MWEKGTESGDGPQSGLMSRRRLLGLSTGTALAVAGLGVGRAIGTRGEGGAAGAGHSLDAAPAAASVVQVTAPPASGVLAANVNESLDAIDYAELAAVSATWIRGFYLMSDADQGDPATQTGMAKLLQAAADGYGTVLSTKFQYHDTAIPVPGTTAMDTALARFDKVLGAVLGTVDILTVGNEPFYETRPVDRTTSLINDFYEAIAQHAVQYRKDHFGTDCKTALYMGALNGLEDPANQNAQTKRWMTFAAGNADIAGVDIHPHVAGIDAAQAYTDFVLPYLRPDQKFLATEFSLIQLWKQHMADPVDPSFTAAYGTPAGTPVWQVIHNAANNPFTEQKWNDFLLSNTWFANHKTFITNEIADLRATGKLAVAGYGITQGAPIPDFGPDSSPWVLNSIFCPYVCQIGTGGLPGRDRTWAASFRTAQ